MISPKLRISFIAAHASLAGLLYGLDTGSIGPITEMYQFRASVGTLSPTIQGFYVASILLSASLSSLASGHISDRISRKFGILSGAILTLVGCTISAASPDLASLICARLITGLGAGQSISVVTVYLCEIAPQDIRGALACVIQLMITIGIAAGYFVAYGSRNIAGSLAWRTPFVVEACIACILSVGMVLVPFSPRWLIQIGREDDARTVLTKLRDADCIDDEMKDIKMSLNFVDQGRQAGFNEMFSRQFRRRTFLGIFLMAFQQLTGIDAVLYFAPILFTQAGFSSERASFLASGISGIINVVFTIPAQIWVDKWGRRQPLIIGGLSMVVCFFVIGSLYAVHGTRMDGQVYLEGRGTQYAVVALIYVFIASYSWSWAVVGKIYACEIIPTCLRAKVCALRVGNAASAGI
ncbi:general substrate transporter [Gloeophyllum trabeum ATCC 11539]|uniref:General substrate transporter n=1 Tax=Gloeophyllum trabeum (strain ATCC 11539 / FP-39264 / Madison 617) TaxID=670483 RepID=S7PZY5_GLOTA|nr:general substrate transporter [Gloeophyllum trabeum ATCC 11539]EPQ52847.1 general substrate transporter [Gloeophyllum trabeum ATCC 11539]